MSGPSPSGDREIARKWPFGRGLPSEEEAAAYPESLVTL